MQIAQKKWKITIFFGGRPLAACILEFIRNHKNFWKESQVEKALKEEDLQNAS